MVSIRPAMRKTPKTTRSADEIAEKASRGEDISGYFTNKFTTVRPKGKTGSSVTRLDTAGAGSMATREKLILVGLYLAKYDLPGLKKLGFESLWKRSMSSVTLQGQSPRR